MQLTEHQYENKPGRYFIDGVRVSKSAYDHTIIKARISGKRHECFKAVTKINRKGAITRRIFYSCIN